MYGDQLFHDNTGPAVKLEAQPWCTQCLWKLRRTNRKQPGMENSLQAEKCQYHEKMECIKNAFMILGFFVSLYLLN